jgi:5'-nucleotidase/UDP-sugar diphosphatase
VRSWLVPIATALGLACSAERDPRRPHGTLDVAVLHTADLHSRLFPRTLRVGARDAERGVGTYGSEVAVGGAARLGAVLRGERRRNPRTFAFDCGDAVQGTAIFNAFRGQAEIAVLSALELDAQVLGNHEFDLSPEELSHSYANARFPVVSANLFTVHDGSGLLDFVTPWTVVQTQGFRVGVIGVSNPSSPAQLRQRPNAFGAVVLEAAWAVQLAIDALRPLVDLIAVLTHTGLDADEALIRATSGIDLVLGGHQHFVLDQPRQVWDCAGSDVAIAGRSRRCVPRPVLLLHSGAFGKFVGRLELRVSDDPRELSPSYDPLDGFEVVRFEHELLPVTAAAGEDLATAALLAPYHDALGAELGGGRVTAYALGRLDRYGVTQGDSPLGNLVATALRTAAEADIAFVNTTGIRADLPAGPITPESWYEVLPFDDEVAVVSLLGRDLANLFRALGKRALERGTSPLQISGARLRFETGACASGGSCATAWIAEPAARCDSPGDCASAEALCAADLDRGGRRCFEPIAPERVYTVATTSYLASGPSGYEALGRGARGGDGVVAREAVAHWVESGAACGASASAFAECRLGVAEFQRELCSGAPSGRTLAGCALGPELEQRAGALCRHLPCIVGERDGRIELTIE